MVKKIAPECYEGIESYKSWSEVLYMYITDRTAGPFSRMKRKVKKSEQWISLYIVSSNFGPFLSGSVMVTTCSKLASSFFPI